LRQRATNHRIKLDVTVDERLGDFVGDERKIKQILLNLLSNAVKFTPEGGRIGINARQVDGSVEISVSDTGIGISPEDQARIFEEFRQVGGDYAHKREGTGLGSPATRAFCCCASSMRNWRSRKNLPGFSTIGVIRCSSSTTPMRCCVKEFIRSAQATRTATTLIHCAAIPRFKP